MVESLWARLKRKYLKYQPKPSLEVLGDIIMNQYIRSRRQIIHGIRQGTTQPAWYTDFSTAWRAMITSLIAEAQEVEEPEILFTRQQREYRTSIDDWWCKCPAYVSSPYHTCKHLVRFVSAIDQPSGRGFVFQPFRGSVYRQSSAPLIWIDGLHDLETLTAGGLWDPNWE